MADYGRLDWIANRVEEAIDPDRPIIDAHHHLWDRADGRYLADELISDTTRSHNITHTVFVECSAGYSTDAPDHLRPVGETRFVADQAEQIAVAGGPPIGAIVSFADMTLGDAVEEVLAAHHDAAPSLFRGVRHGVNWSRHDGVKNGHHNPTEELMGEASFRAGVARLATMGYSFEAWMYHDQLATFAELAAAIPSCTFVLNHLGGPLGIGPYAAHRDEMLSTWRAGIEAVARHDNVVIKVGGIGMEHYYGTTWSTLPSPPASETVAAHWQPLVHFAIDAFGPNRCMFESNYPVDRQTLPYAVLWNTLQRLAAQYADAEQDALFSDTAARVYQIAPRGEH